MSKGNFDERRRYRRVNLELPARFMTGDGNQINAELIDFSFGGAAISSDYSPKAGERIVTYIDVLQRFEGTVVRKFDKGFAIFFELSERRVSQLAEKLSFLRNRPLVGAQLETRRFQRISANRSVQFQYSGGAPIDCRIIDFSVIGACVESTVAPPVGAKITLGGAKARVVRHVSDGFAVEFSSYWENLPQWQRTAHRQSLIPAYDHHTRALQLEACHA